MTSELKPCPFCGAKAKFKGGRLSQESVTIWCENLHRSGGFTTKEAAAADWNTRAMPDVPELLRYEYDILEGAMEPYPTGEYVRHSQAAKIIAAKDKEIERAEKNRNDMADRIVDQRTEIAALKAENERLREALQNIANLYQPRTPIQRAINIAKAALNVETSHDKG